MTNPVKLKSNPQMEEQQTSCILKIQNLRIWDQNWTLQSTVGGRYTNAALPLIPWEKRAEREKKLRGSGPRKPARLPALGVAGAALTGQGLPTTAGVITMVGASAKKEKRKEVPELHTLMEIFAGQRGTSEQTVKGREKISTSAYLSDPDSLSLDDSLKPRPPKPISRRLRRSTLSQGAAPFQTKPTGSLDIRIEGVALSTRASSAGAKHKADEAIREEISFPVLQPAPPAGPKPRKLSSSRRCAGFLGAPGERGADQVSDDKDSDSSDGEGGRSPKFVPPKPISVVHCVCKKKPIRNKFETPLSCIFPSPAEVIQEEEEKV